MVAVVHLVVRLRGTAEEGKLHFPACLLTLLSRLGLLRRSVCALSGSGDNEMRVKPLVLVEAQVSGPVLWRGVKRVRAKGGSGESRAGQRRKFLQSLNAALSGVRKRGGGAESGGRLEVAPQCIPLPAP